MNGLKTFIIGLIGLNAAMGAAVLTSLVLSWGFGIAVGVILGLAVIVASFLSRRGALFFCGIYAAVGAVIVGMYVRDYVTAKSGGIVEGISVRQTLGRETAGGYRFRDAVLRADIRGQVLTTHTDTHGQRTSSWHYVAAVVPEDWTSGEPVGVWAACGEIASCRGEWTKPHGAGVRLNPETVSIEDFKKAAENAAITHGVMSHPNAVFIAWVENPVAAIEKNKSDAVQAAKIWNIVWLVTFLAAAAWSLRRKRKAERLAQGKIPPVSA